MSHQQVGKCLLRGKGRSPSKVSREMFLPGCVKVTAIVLRFAVGHSWYAFSCENAYKWNRSQSYPGIASESATPEVFPCSYRNVEIIRQLL